MAMPCGQNPAHTATHLNLINADSGKCPRNCIKTSKSSTTPTAENLQRQYTAGALRSSVPLDRVDTLREIALAHLKRDKSRAARY